MDQVKKGLNNFQNFLMTPTGTYITLTIIIILLIILIAKYSEGFEGIIYGMNNFADYPKSFNELILPEVPGQMAEIRYENYFIKPTEEVKPNSEPVNQLSLEKEEELGVVMTPEKEVLIPEMTIEAPVDIGNGVVAMAEVSIPTQTTEVPSQTPMELPKPEKTDIQVESQIVDIPTQEGIMQTKIEGTESFVSVPMTIPAQKVRVKKQKSIIPVYEPFRSM